MNINKLIKTWLPVIVWMGIIFTLSHQPSLHSGLDNWLDFILRKIAHITEYGILCFVLIRALKAHTQIDKKTIVICALLALLYAVSDEYHQTFVFGRHGSLRDIAIDSIGILIISSLYLTRFQRE